MTKLAGRMACVGAVLLLVVAMVAGVTATAAPNDTPKIDGAWVRLPAVPGRPAAGYAILEAGTRAVELVAVSSPLARVAMHNSSMAGGVMRMDLLPSVKVAAGGRHVFAPGAAHLMLFDLPATVAPGASVPLVFSFADGTSVRVDAVARAAGTTAPAPAGHGAH